MIGPLALWAIVYVVVMGFRDAEQMTADDNAGRILNARVVEDDVVRSIDRMLAERRPRVLVLGPSYANTDVRPADLARRLDLKPSEVALVSVPNSIGAHWYAILKYRVLQAGHRPDLVLFVSGLQSMLLTTPLSESSFVNLRVHLPEEGDPRIDAKGRGGLDLWWATVRQQRGKVRGAFFDAIRDGAVFWADPSRTRGALGRVFDDANIDMELYGRVMPVIESSARAERGFMPDLLPAPEESFLRDTTALATEAGSMAVWVRPPMSPHIPAELDDVAPPGFQARAIEIVGQAGGAYVDLRHLRMTSRMFRNADHMNLEGSGRFTRALARVIRERGWLGAPEVSDWPVEVSGGASLGSGDRLEVRASSAWPDDRGEFAIWLSAESRGERTTPPFRLRFDDVPIEVKRGRALGLDGVIWQQWRMQAGLPAPSGPSTLTLDATWPGLTVQGLAFGQDEPRIYVIGDRGALLGERVELLGAGVLAPGVALSTPRPVALVPKARRPVTDLPGRIGAFDTRYLGFLSDEVLQGSVSWSEPCSPLRIAEDGVLLAHANSSCTGVRSLGHGRSCHTSDNVFFAASDGTDPARNRRDYELRLAESRMCGGEVFLYPADVLRFTIEPERLEPLHRGVRFLVLEGRYLQRRKAEVTVEVRAGDAGPAVATATFDGRRFDEGPIWVRFPAAVPDGEPWTVQIENLDHTFHLIRRIALAERRPRQ